MNEATKRLLRDLGYFVGLEGNSDTFYCAWAPSKAFLTPKHAVGEGEAWAACLAHAESEEGMRANHCEVERQLIGYDGSITVYHQPSAHGPLFHASGCGAQASGVSPEAAAFALLRKVMGV